MQRTLRVLNAVYPGRITTLALQKRARVCSASTACHELRMNKVPVDDARYEGQGWEGSKIFSYGLKRRVAIPKN